MRLNGPGHLVRTQATGAGVNPLRGTVHNSLDTFNIRLPGAVRTSVGVGYLDAESHTLSADIAFCHNHLHLLFKAIRFFQGMNRPRPTSLKKNNGYILADPAGKSKLFFHFPSRPPCVQETKPLAIRVACVYNKKHGGHAIEGKWPARVKWKGCLLYDRDEGYADWRYSRY